MLCVYFDFVYILFRLHHALYTPKFNFTKLIWDSSKVLHLRHTMLSFFRKKSLEESNQSADQTVPKTSSSRSNSICDNMQSKDSDTLVRELGYNNLTEMKETIYGKR